MGDSSVEGDRARIRIKFGGKRAVSPIIATILLVAITVVLAAVLYVLISGLDSSSSSRPYEVAFGSGTPSQIGTGASAVYFDQKAVSVTDGLTTSIFAVKLTKPSGTGITLGTAAGCAPTTAGSNAFTTCTGPGTAANPAAWFIALSDPKGGVVATFDSTGWHYPAGVSSVTVTNAHQIVVITGGQASSTSLAGSANVLAVYGTARSTVTGSTVL